MLRRLKWMMGLKERESLAVVPVRDFYGGTMKKKKKKEDVLEMVQEIAVYIHRFHNVDLLQQGWYQIKITTRWEDSENPAPGTPARVVQYEAPDLGGDNNIHGVWRIDDDDNSFSTQPFRIKYIRQDVVLPVMVSFNLSLDKYEGPPTSAVILKFELFYSPALSNEFGSQTFIEGDPASVHEFRIPSKALLGLHSYCPVHFDSFHAALVDLSIHISILKVVVHKPFANASSARQTGDSIRDSYEAKTQVVSVRSSPITLVKTLLSAREVLIKELYRISKAIDVEIDFTNYKNLFDEARFLHSHFNKDLEAMQSDTSRLDDLQYKAENGGDIDAYSVELLPWLSTDSLSSYFHFVGNQMLYLWNMLLNFHRLNRRKIIEFLRESWAIDRKVEWSIWMVYSKAEMPHQYLSTSVDSSSYHGYGNKDPIMLKLSDDPAQASVLRADLHRRSIAQMRINNRSIQDLQIFGDPSRIPIVLVERLLNLPLRTTSGNSYFRSLSNKDVPSLLGRPSSKASKLFNNSSSSNNIQNTHVLKIVVFVHGFQGHHLDLRLVRNQWLLIDPKAEFLLSEANEGKTSGDFQVMGLRLAQEVISFVKAKMDRFSKKFGRIANIKLSFVGHSIGNLIIRAALSESMMEPYLRFLYTYVSVSGPHLGYMYSSNSLFNSGLWLLKKFKNTQCIHQLTYTDDPDLRNTFLYQLCKQRTLDNFRNIILLSSPQDGYVPYHSARIEVCAASTSDNSKKGKVFLEMLNECLDQIRAPSSDHRIIMRCDVNFDISTHGRNINTFIGRAAHIEFLESDIFARFIMWSFPELFR